MNIYIDVNEKNVVFKNEKDDILNIYSNLSTGNKTGIAKSVKLLTYAINKVFLINGFDLLEFKFYINDVEIVSLIKDDYTNTIIEKVQNDWKEKYDLNAISELGNFLKMFSKIHSKDIIAWEKNEDFEYQIVREGLYKLQSECDIEIQDVIHEIRNLKKEELNAINNSTYIYKIWYASQRRLKVKNKIKKINNELKRRGGN